MTKQLSVPTALVNEIQAYVTGASLDLQITPGSGGDVEVQEATERRQAEGRVLYLGGWIDCAGAWSVASQLDIPREKMGKFLDALKIKVKNCQLGCF